MTNYVTPQEEYEVKPRRISGTHVEKLEQIDAAIQELLDIKLLECAAERPGVRFVAVPRPRSHAVAMTVTILAMLVLLILLLGVRTSHAQTAAPQPTPASAAAQAPADDSPFAHIKFGATLEGYYQYDATIPTTASSRCAPMTRAPIGPASVAAQVSAANEPRPDAYRNLWQACGTYVFPVGKGLQVDFGKFASNLGYEANYAKDDFNFWRAYLLTSCRSTTAASARRCRCPTRSP
jgi:hypothetical protein